VGKRTIAAAALVAGVVTCLLAAAQAGDVAAWRGYVRRVVDAFGPNSRVVAMTITLAAVYAPIGFQAGLTGTLFREFAFTLVGAVIISGIVAYALAVPAERRSLESVTRPLSASAPRPQEI